MKEAIQNFLGKDGVFVVENKETGKYRVYRVTYSSKMESDIIGIKEDRKKFFTTGLGFLNDNNIFVWKKNRNTDYEKHARFIERLTQDQALASKYNILPAISCCKCSERLDNPDSIRAGIGPVCAKH